MLAYVLNYSTALPHGQFAILVQFKRELSFLTILDIFYTNVNECMHNITCLIVVSNCTTMYVVLVLL